MCCLSICVASQKYLLPLKMCCYLCCLSKCDGIYVASEYVLPLYMCCLWICVLMSGSGLVASQYVWPLINTCSLSKCCLSKRVVICVAPQNVTSQNVLPLKTCFYMCCLWICVLQSEATHVTCAEKLYTRRKIVQGHVTWPLDTHIQRQHMSVTWPLNTHIQRQHMFKGQVTLPCTIFLCTCFFLFFFHICGVLFSFFFDHVFYPTYPPPQICSVPW